MKLKKNIATTLNEYLTNSEIYLRKYLDQTPEEKKEYLPQQFYYLFDDFIYDTDTDFTMPTDTYITTDGEETVDKFDDNLELMIWAQYNDKKLYNAFADYLYKNILDYTLGIDDTEYPSWTFFDNRSELVKNQWLIHFTNDAINITKTGFRYGVDDVEKLGLTKLINDFDKKQGGYNFAYTLKDFHKYAKNNKGGYHYGDEAVLFKASGVRIWHNSDDEYQTIFYGNTATDIIPITKDYDEWVVKDKYNKTIYKNETLETVVDWIIKNFDQYRKSILKSKI